MKILLTNDDGIYADGIYALCHALKGIGHITVVAPDSEKSSVGHGITLAHPILYKKVRRDGRFFGYGITGTPADCVKFAVGVILKKKPDIIISGINLGPNDGCSVFYSGTVAGAREGAMMGIPSIAVSLGSFVVPDFSFAAKVAANLVKYIKQGHRVPKGTFLNVNVPHLPACKIRGIKMTRQGTEPIHERFHKRTDPNLRDYYWMSGKLPVNRKDNRYDTYAMNNGYVAVTPIHTDSTDHGFLTELERWKI